jgi:hypothetical protein
MSQNCIVSVKFLKDVGFRQKCGRLAIRKLFMVKLEKLFVIGTFDYMRITFPFEPLTKIKERVFIFSIYLAKI